MRLHLSWRDAVVALVIAASVTGVDAAVNGGGQSQPVHASSGQVQDLPPVVVQPDQPTDLQTVETQLGPFAVLPASNSPTPDTQYPAVLLARYDGSLAASQRWKLSTDLHNWTNQEAIQITNLSVHNGFATFSTGPAQVYTVHVDQPFVLENVPQYVMLIDEQGKQWQISTAKAIASRQTL